MKFRIIEDQREMFPIRVLCDVMGVSPAGYYAWRAGPKAHARRECQRFCVRGYRDRLISIGVNAPPPESDRRTG